MPYTTHDTRHASDTKHAARVCRDDRAPIYNIATETMSKFGQADNCLFSQHSQDTTNTRTHRSPCPWVQSAADRHVGNSDPDAGALFVSRPRVISGLFGFQHRPAVRDSPYWDGGELLVLVSSLSAYSLRVHTIIPVVHRYLDRV
jgi:hypothetical protein